jgi:hypothetical protein
VKGENCEEVGQCFGKCEGKGCTGIYVRRKRRRRQPSRILYALLGLGLGAGVGSRMFDTTRVETMLISS